MSMGLNKELVELIDGKQLVSFDIFDTLLLRTYLRPEDVFVAVERKTKCRGFAKRRTSAEILARKKIVVEGGGGIALEDIYSYMGSKPVYSSEDVDFWGNWQQKVCREIQQPIVTAAKFLDRCGVRCTAADLNDYIDAFRRRLSSNDACNFSFVVQRYGVGNNRRYLPFRSLICFRGRTIRVFGHTVIQVRFVIKGLKRYATFYLLGRVPFFKIRIPF